MAHNILPFPSCRRRRLVRTQAAQIASLSPPAGERHLARQLVVQGDALRRRQIDEGTIAKDLTELEAAIRAELWQTRDAMGGRA